ncbi:MAG: hypothetical protein WCF57_09555 [Pyrinomonadaceae bacterium]
MQQEDGNEAVSVIASDIKDSDENGSPVAANIERYLDNHTREGATAWQFNMAAVPADWQIIASDTSTQDGDALHQVG